MRDGGSFTRAVELGDLEMGWHTFPWSCCAHPPQFMLQAFGHLLSAGRRHPEMEVEVFRSHTCTRVNLCTRWSGDRTGPLLTRTPHTSCSTMSLSPAATNLVCTFIILSFPESYRLGISAHSRGDRLFHSLDGIALGSVRGVSSPSPQPPITSVSVCMW